MSLDELEQLLEAVRERHERFGPDEEGRRRVRDHLRNLACLEESPLDHIDPGPVTFPDRLPVAFAVCHPECGRAEFIVEGSTQECQGCGGHMFRIEAAWYRYEQRAE